MVVKTDMWEDKTLKTARSLIRFLLWDLSFYVMISIMIIVTGYISSRYETTFEIQYRYMGIGLRALMWFLAGAFLVLLFQFLRESGARRFKPIEFLLVSIPALYAAGLDLWADFRIPVFPFAYTHINVFGPIGALVFGCAIWAAFLRKRK